ncbi:CLUMA_CG003970, isoform A [Clunio marinus]|uniref:CLUMA_CG003970, isoform A n=1 Tax=Clunio marinus TaxID=568069 RepID=A0A1J1HQL0_9DIPT|nr:CLUMA_CG003970, isoform A [Clunio marinus]
MLLKVIWFRLCFGTTKNIDKTGKDETRADCVNQIMRLNDRQRRVRMIQCHCTEARKMLQHAREMRPPQAWHFNFTWDLSVLIN